MRRSGLHALSSSSSRPATGLTLIELLVTLVILSILAAAALPYAELTVRRDKELELRRALREIRTAIDGFHDDWAAGRISKLNDAVSDDGYPKTLLVLVEGVEASGAKGSAHRYLRRVPRDPFADAAQPTEEQWVLRGYQDEADSIAWDGKDVYDVHSASEGSAIDGTHYKDW
jgi:general secretion pathway protein G